MSIPSPRVGIISFQHESNTFIPEKTTFEHFRRSTYSVGEEIREKYRKAFHEIGGFIEVLESEGMEPVTLFRAHTAPWGKVSDEALDSIWAVISEQLDKAGKLDGILLAPHGAGVNESRHDMDGWWMTKVREKVGDLPIITTLDPHTNLSSTMISAVDALVAYRENPHLDQRQRGIEAARLMVRTLRGEIRPVSAAAFPPVLINIESQLTSAEPMLSLTREVDAVRALPGVLTASTILGFPYADIADVGSSFIVVTDNDPALAQQLADRLANWLVENRALYRGVMISPEEAFARVESAAKPVGLLDMGDNVGGGAPGDSMILAELFEKSGRYKALCPIASPEDVKRCEAAGVGARIHLSLGGKLPMTPSKPLEVDATILNICDGVYTEDKPRHGGRIGGDLGRVAVVRSDAGVTYILTTARGGISGSPAPMRAVGVEPTEYEAIILRGVHAPVGGFAEICNTLIRVNTPGVTTADMVGSLEFKNRRKPLYPFEEIA